MQKWLLVIGGLAAGVALGMVVTLMGPSWQTASVPSTPFTWQLVTLGVFAGLLVGLVIGLALVARERRRASR